MRCNRYSGVALMATVVRLRVAACFVHPTFRSSSFLPTTITTNTDERRRKNHFIHRPMFSATPEGKIDGGDDSDGGVVEYWEANSDKWEKVLRILDVRASYALGSLDGILPSGRPSRGAPNERLLSLSRALELFEEDEQTFLVRRRFRKMKLEELRPRWERVMEKRNELRKEGKWEDAVVESEKYREFQKSLVDGTVESEEASPAYSRFVVTLLSPALKAAAKQRNKADGGVMEAQAELLQTAGSTPSERWITAAILAELEEELETIISTATTTVGAATTSRANTDFATQEAEQDIQDAGMGALYGVLLAIVTAVLVSSLQ